MDLIPGWGDPLEKEMATHSSILTWETPWTEKPGGYSKWELQKSWTQLSNETKQQFKATSQTGLS